MTYFNVDIPFIQAASWQYLLAWTWSTVVMQPLLFWGCYRAVARQKIPWYFYLGLGAIFWFWQPNLPLNDLVTIIFATLTVYYGANPRGERLTTVASWFGMAMVAYYSGITCAHYLGILVRNQLPLLRAPYAVIGQLVMLAIAVFLVRLARPLLARFFRVVNPGHPVAAWTFAAAFIPFGAFYYLIEYNQGPFTKWTGLTLVQSEWLAVGIILVGFLALLGAMHLVARILARGDDLATTQQRLANLTDYTSELEVMYDDLRRFKHDYLNILASLQSALASNDLAYAKRALAQLTESSNQLTRMPTAIFGNLQNIQDPGVKSISYAKLRQALDQHLDARLEVVKPIRLTTTLAQLDAVRIIALLMDNAIRAAAASPSKKVSLALFENENAQFIVVGNATKEEHLDLTRLSRIEHAVTIGSSHHLGLRNLQIILGRYPTAVLDRSSRDHWFEQRIVIPK